MLSTCSDYFVEILNRTQCKHPVIVLKDIRQQDLEALLNYMYVGEVNVVQNELACLIKAAECLRIKGLAVPDEPLYAEEDANQPEVNACSESKQKKRRLEGDSVGREIYTSNKRNNCPKNGELPVSNNRQNEENETTSSENQQKSNKSFNENCRGDQYKVSA